MGGFAEKAAKLTTETGALNDPAASTDPAKELRAMVAAIEAAADTLVRPWSAPPEHPKILVREPRAIAHRFTALTDAGALRPPGLIQIDGPFERAATLQSARTRISEGLLSPEDSVRAAAVKALGLVLATANRTGSKEPYEGFCQQQVQLIAPLKLNSDPRVSQALDDRDLRLVLVHCIIESEPQPGRERDSQAGKEAAAVLAASGLTKSEANQFFETCYYLTESEVTAKTPAGADNWVPARQYNCLLALVRASNEHQGTRDNPRGGYLGRNEIVQLSKLETDATATPAQRRIGVRAKSLCDQYLTMELF